jgi:DNA replication protein DnaD
MLGWIKLHRKLIDNPLYFSQKFIWSLAWIDLLLLAAHKKHIVEIKGRAITLYPGQLCYSKRSLASRWKWDKRTVSKFLNMLQGLEMIYQTDVKVTTVITIKNWNEYQNMEYEDGN